MYIGTALAAGFAVLSTTQAFLVPPNVGLSKVHDVKEEVEASITSLFSSEKAWTVSLDCPHCPWGGVEDVDGVQTQWNTNWDTAIELTIDADHDHGLLINNIATLTTASASPQPVSLVATQVRKDTGDQTPPFPIDFVLERLEPVHAPEDPLKMIVPVRFTVVGFGQHPVKVDTISINLLQTPESLRVMRIEKVAYDETPGAHSCEGTTKWSYCRVKAIVLSRIMETIREMRQKAHRAKTWAKHCGSQAGAAAASHKPGHPSSHGRHHYRAHRWARMLHSALRFFVIPALLGVIGGLIASAIGMLVGHFIVFLWLRFGRGGRRNRVQCYDDEVVEIIITEDEKNGLLDSEDEFPPPPPRYEDVEAQEENS